MTLILILFIISCVQALDPEKQQDHEEELKNIILKYVNDIPDPEPKYVTNPFFSKLISKYYGGKIQTFPMYRISLKIDRKPVKIPWTLGQDSDSQTKIVKVKKVE